MIKLEHLADGSVTDRNFVKLAGLVLDTGGQSVGLRFGTFSGTTSATGELTTTVAHGLARTPGAVLLTSNSSSGTQITARAINLTATTFDVYVVRSAAAAVAVGGYWAVIG